MEKTELCEGSVVVLRGECESFVKAGNGLCPMVYVVIGISEVCGQKFFDLSEPENSWRQRNRKGKRIRRAKRGRFGRWQLIHSRDLGKHLKAIQEETSRRAVAYVLAATSAESEPNTERGEGYGNRTN